MKYVSFNHDGLSRLGILTADGVIDLNAAQPQVPSDLGAALVQGIDLHAAAMAAVASTARSEERRVGKEC